MKSDDFWIILYTRAIFSVPCSSRDSSHPCHHIDTRHTQDATASLQLVLKYRCSNVKTRLTLFECVIFCVQFSERSALVNIQIFWEREAAICVVHMPRPHFAHCVFNVLLCVTACIVLKHNSFKRAGEACRARYSRTHRSQICFYDFYFIFSTSPTLCSQFLRAAQ